MALVTVSYHSNKEQLRMKCDSKKEKKQKNKYSRQGHTYRLGWPPVHYVAKEDPKFPILQLLHPKYWVYRCAPHTPLNVGHSKCSRVDLLKLQL